MIEIFLTGVGLLAVMATWKWVWQPTVLDTTRDTLFDLRDNVLREHFIKNGISLDHPLYLHLRTLLNGHLRHTESLTFWEFVGVRAELDKAEKLAAGITEINNRFKSDDPALQALADEIRFKSSVAMLSYMVETSVFSMLAMLFVAPVLWMRKLPLKSVFITSPGMKARSVMERYALVA